MRFVSYNERKKVAAALKPIYQAPDAEAARTELDDFAASELGKRNPHTVAAFRNAWERFIPFLAFPPMLRRVIYTTNAIESLNYQLRKVTKNRGPPPTTPWSNCCGWPSAPSKTNAPENGKTNEENRSPSAPQPAGSSKAKSPPTGNKP